MDKMIKNKIKNLIVLFILLFACVSCKNIGNKLSYDGPKIVDDENSPSGKTTTWQCIFLGSFSQIEIMNDTILDLY